MNRIEKCVFKAIQRCFVVCVVAGGEVKGHPTPDEATFRYLSEVYVQSVSAAEASSTVCRTSDDGGGGKQQLSLSLCLSLSVSLSLSPLCR